MIAKGSVVTLRYPDRNQIPGVPFGEYSVGTSYQVMNTHNHDVYGLMILIAAKSGGAYWISAASFENKKIKRNLPEWF